MGYKLTTINQNSITKCTIQAEPTFDASLTSDGSGLTKWVNISRNFHENLSNDSIFLLKTQLRWMKYNF